MANFMLCIFCELKKLMKSKKKNDTHSFADNMENTVERKKRKSPIILSANTCIFSSQSLSYAYLHSGDNSI